MSHFLHYFSRRYLPRWMVLVMDVIIVVLSWGMAYLLRFNFMIPEIGKIINPWQLVWIIPAAVVVFRIKRTYSGILRQSTAMDILQIIHGMFYLAVLLTLVSLAGRPLHLPAFFIIPASVIIIMLLCATFFISMTRLGAKFIFRFARIKKNAKSIVIYGAGKLGQITRNVLINDPDILYDLVAFIDDNPSLQEKKLAGTPIWSDEAAFEKHMEKENVEELIFAIDPAKITKQRKREIIDRCMKNGISVKEVPSVKEWINGKMNAKDIRRINIEDLLGRDAIRLDSQRIAKGLKSAVVLVTGGAGSIGSEIVRQLIKFNTKQVILLDKAESDLFNFQQELLSKYPGTRFVSIVGDVTNQVKMRNLFKTYHPDIVFNAAAYKHVPLMEEFPCEALRVNVGGTKNLADLSVEFDVKKFVLISTDKAVNPTNIMGTTKRIAEIYIQSLSQANIASTRFITTRFGNVLGSNGSVVPTFKKQIAAGGPVTVTHKEITRYFMTIPEASQLVLEAGFMGEGGEIFLFDMGDAVKIYDLAEKMIALSGFVPGRDIQIKITGLRPGEKLYEELLHQKENILPTHNDKIMIGKVKKHEYNVVNEQINDLLTKVDLLPAEELVRRMKRLVPEFNPMNARYAVPSHSGSAFPAAQGT